jgi:hypothetical protein
MREEERLIVEGVLLRAPRFHVVAHIGDDRLFEFLGHSVATRAEGGLITLRLLGEPGEGQDASIFQHIRHQLLIELIPLDVEPRLLNNLRLRHSRIECDNGKTLILRVEVRDVADPRAIDAQSATAVRDDGRRLLNDMDATLRAALQSAVIERCEHGHRFAKLPDHPMRHGLPRCPQCMAIGLDVRNVLSMCNKALRTTDIAPRVEAVHVLEAALSQLD